MGTEGPGAHGRKTEQVGWHKPALPAGGGRRAGRQASGCARRLGAAALAACQRHQRCRQLRHLLAIPKDRVRLRPLPGHAGQHVVCTDRLVIGRSPPRLGQFCASIKFAANVRVCTATDQFGAVLNNAKARTIGAVEYACCQLAAMQEERKEVQSQHTNDLDHITFILMLLAAARPACVCSPAIRQLPLLTKLARHEARCDTAQH